MDVDKEIKEQIDDFVKHMDKSHFIEDAYSLCEALMPLTREGDKTLFYFINEVKEKTGFLLEMGRVDHPKKDAQILGNREVWVYADDRSNMTPHFHYFDKDNTFNVEVRISDLSICKSAPRKGVSKEHLLDWSYGLSKHYKVLKKWLLMDNADYPKYNNYKSLQILWNQVNPDNRVEIDPE